MQFDQSDLLATLEAASDADLDAQDFGVIGLAADGTVARYNTWETRCANLDRHWVMGRDFFNDVGICMNNFLVAQRFDEEPTLDEQLDYVLTYRMRPTPVRLRLLAAPGARHRWIVVTR